MKPERIQVRIGEKTEWSTPPTALTRHWVCNSFLDAARLARIAHNILVDSPISKEITAHDRGVAVRLLLPDPESAEALFNARDQLDAAVAAAGF